MVVRAHTTGKEHDTKSMIVEHLMDPKPLSRTLLHDFHEKHSTPAGNQHEADLQHIIEAEKKPVHRQH
jgi:hypothetical protein